MTTRRITIVGSELLGRPGTGGPGAADSLLAIALGQRGHQVELVIASGRDIGLLGQKWTQIYDSAGARIRVLERMAGVRPAYLAPAYEVFQALGENPPDVVIVDDWRALGYAALRARQAHRALAETAFVLYCHGPGRVLTTVAQKVPDTVDRFAEQLAEKASMQLADAVVSPTRWLLDWMREHRWPVPDSARVIQLLRESAVLGSTPPPAQASAPIHRLAFFGPLREGKGIRVFLAALNELEPGQLDGVELLFLGSESSRWPRDRIIGALPAHTRQAVRIETQLEREAALDELRRPGTLAVMPSILDNSPNTVAECIEFGIPFIASATGGIPELVAEADHERVLCPPTPDGLATALKRALANSDAAPVRPARDPHDSIEAWLELVDAVEPATAPGVRRATRVAVVASGDESERRAQRLAAQTRTVEVDVVRDSSRRAGLERTDTEWVVFLDDEDQPDDQLLDVLVAAQAASGADAVTVAVRPADLDGAVQLFLGDPGPLGLVENQYGVLGLVRASAAVADLPPDGAVDPDWPLFARLALGRARIVSLPEPLSTHLARPGRVEDVPGDGVLVLESFEQSDGAALFDLPQLAATIAAAYAREVARPRSPAAPPFLHRLAARLGRLTTPTSRRPRRGSRP